MDKTFFTWLVLVAKQYKAWLPSSAIAAGCALVAGSLGWQPRPWVFWCIGFTGFIYSFFAVWRDSYTPPSNGPELRVEWVFTELMNGNDEIRVINEGPGTALDIRIGPLSWPEYEWSQERFQSLEAGTSIRAEMPITFVGNPKQFTSIVSMRQLMMDNTRRKTLEFPVTYTDIKGRQFSRKFRMNFEENWTVIIVPAPPA